MNEKTCTKCGETFPRTKEFFHADKKTKDGFKCRCKQCCSEYKKEYCQNNREQIKEYKKEYYQNNREQIKEYNKEYREKNKEYSKNQPAGVYKITNTKTGTIYIGQSTGHPQRWNCHKSHLRHNKHDNSRLQEDYNIYGKEAFIFEVIEQFPCNTSSDVLLEKEEEQIKKHLREGKGLYNRRRIM